MDGENTIRPIFKKDESITDLLGKIASGSATLVREELQLARQEMRERFQALTAGAVTTAIGRGSGLGGLPDLVERLPRLAVLFLAGPRRHGRRRGGPGPRGGGGDLCRPQAFAKNHC